MMTDDPLAGEYRLIPGSSDCPEGCSYTKDGEPDTWCFKSGPYFPDTCTVIVTPETIQTNTGQEIEATSQDSMSDKPGTKPQDTPAGLTGSQDRTTSREYSEETVGMSQ